MIEPACSSASLDVGEPLIGSAPDAVAWVCLEQNGPWGAKAWTDSHLDPVIGREIEDAAGAHGVRPALIRRPGRHADPGTSTDRQLLIAYTRPGRSWLLVGTIAEPEALLDLNWAAVARGDLGAAGLPGMTRAPDPVLLVCTNGTRDTCCARLGRPVALVAAETHPDQVWEVTHTSGHRLAATTVLLPSGALHGRVVDGTGLLAAATAGELVLNGYRGRSTWSAGAQVAEDLIRRAEGITGIDDLDVVPQVDAWSVRHRDGRSWWVAVSSQESGMRPESCGKEAKPIRRYAARIVDSAPAD